MYGFGSKLRKGGNEVESISWACEDVCDYISSTVHSIMHHPPSSSTLQVSTYDHSSLGKLPFPFRHPLTLHRDWVLITAAALICKGWKEKEKRSREKKRENVVKALSFKERASRAFVIHTMIRASETFSKRLLRMKEEEKRILGRLKRDGCWIVWPSSLLAIFDGRICSSSRFIFLWVYQTRRWNIFVNFMYSWKQLYY